MKNTQSLGFLPSNLNQNKAKQRQSIDIPKDFCHAMIVGQTGCGKTTSAILPTIQDRINNGYGILTFDYKGKEHLKIKAIAKMAGRLQDVVMLNVPWGTKINICDFLDENVLNKFLQESFESKEPFWAFFAQNIFMTCYKTVKILIHNSEFLAKEINVDLPFDSLNLDMIYNSSCSYENMRRFFEEIVNIGNSIKFNHKAKKILQTQDINKTKLQRIQKQLEIFNNFFGYYFGSSSESDCERKYSNYSMMSSAISDVCTAEFLNKDGKNLCELLEGGKIVIVNLANTNERVFSLISSSVLHKFSKIKPFAKQKKISVIIDEAGRVIEKNTDLHADVLRENGVELVLAFQNNAVLKEKLGVNKYEEVAGNLTHQYFFQNPLPQFCCGKDMNFSNLDTFEYYHNGNEFMAEPILLNEFSLQSAELEYQRLNNVQNIYTADKTEKNEILVHDIDLADDFLIYGYDVMSKKIRTLTMSM